MSSDTDILPVPDELAGRRLDQALAAMFPQYSRSRLKSWILQGNVTVNGAVLRPRDPVSGGEEIVLSPQAEAVSDACPEPIEFAIAFEDDALLVVNKPAGLVVHPGAGNSSGTLMNGLLHSHPELQELPRAGIIHRLDKDTSGLMLVGKTLETHTALVRLLADREITRQYAAVCNGVLTGGGSIDAPIGRHPVDRLRMSVQERGKPAVTHYRVRQRFAAHSYIGVTLETGRTHQIRVHFAHKRHALVGDPTYGGRLAIPAGATHELADGLRNFRRQALHAERLSLSHPVSAEPIDIRAPLPADFADLLVLLGQDCEARK
jgi:23S rRNA pseudouridine1911/1915/1917 synthase